MAFTVRLFSTAKIGWLRRWATSLKMAVNATFSCSLASCSLPCSEHEPVTTHSRAKPPGLFEVLVVTRASRGLTEYWMSLHGIAGVSGGRERTRSMADQAFVVGARFGPASFCCGGR